MPAIYILHFGSIPWIFKLPSTPQKICPNKCAINDSQVERCELANQSGSTDEAFHFINLLLAALKDD